jgi:hypothetical protein
VKERWGYPRKEDGNSERSAGKVRMKNGPAYGASIEPFSLFCAVARGTGIANNGVGETE